MDEEGTPNAMAVNMPTMLPTTLMAANTRE